MRPVEGFNGACAVANDSQSSDGKRRTTAACALRVLTIRMAHQRETWTALQELGLPSLARAISTWNAQEVRPQQAGLPHRHRAPQADILDVASPLCTAPPPECGVKSLD